MIKEELTHKTGVVLDETQICDMFVDMIERIRQLEDEVKQLRASTQRLIPKGDVYIGRA